MTSWLSALPWWLLAGLALGAAFTLLAAVLFYAGTRLFPSPERDTRAGDADRRRAEIRAYLDALGERYAEDHPVDGGAVAFYLPERDVAITFDARTYFRLDGTGTRAVLVEHELPGAALGPRLPFETPDATPDDPWAASGGAADGAAADRGALGDTADGSDPAETALAELGLPDDADLEDVRTAYRRRVKRVHPDQGGDPEEFQRVREAYTVAKEAVE